MDVKPHLFLNIIPVYIQALDEKLETQDIKYKKPRHFVLLKKLLQRYFGNSACLFLVENIDHLTDMEDIFYFSPTETNLYDFITTSLV